jgi:hypothetical protein
MVRFLDSPAEVPSRLANINKNSSIEWTDRTFNPWWGCSKVCPTCDHCYAELWAKRTGHQLREVIPSAAAGTSIGTRLGMATRLRIPRNGQGQRLPE